MPHGQKQVSSLAPCWICLPSEQFHFNLYGTQKSKCFTLAILLCFIGDLIMRIMISKMKTQPYFCPTLSPDAGFDQDKQKSPINAHHGLIFPGTSHHAFYVWILISCTFIFISCFRFLQISFHLLKPVFFAFPHMDSFSHSSEVSKYMISCKKIFPELQLGSNIHHREALW